MGGAAEDERRPSGLLRLAFVALIFDLFAQRSVVSLPEVFLEI